MVQQIYRRWFSAFFESLRYLQAENVDKIIQDGGMESLGPLAGVPIAVKVMKGMIRGCCHLFVLLLVIPDVQNQLSKCCEGGPVP